MIMNHQRQTQLPETPRQMAPVRFSGTPVTPVTSASVVSSPITPASASSSSGVDSSFSSDSGIGSSPPMASATTTDRSLTTSRDHPPSRTSQYKKIMKPLLERKRRARINKCLDELKDIMTSALQSQGENVSKLEKADILEMTVRHLHKMQQAKCLNARNPIEELRRFQTGYSSCAQEATSFLMNTPGVDASVSHRMLSYLSAQMANPINTAVAFQGRINPMPTMPADLYTPPSSSAYPIPPFSGRISFPPILPSAATHTMQSRLKSHSPISDDNANKISVKPIVSPVIPRLATSPTQSHCGEETPQRPASSPQILMVSITSRPTIDPSTSKDSEPVSSSSPSVIKPAPIRLNPNEPVWRPF